MADRIKNYQQEADQITTLKAIRTDLGVTPSSYTPDATVVTKDRVVTFAQAEEELVVLSDIEKGVKQQIVDVDIAQKDISNIKALLQGNLYDYQTDSTSAYTKSVPAGAMPYAGLEKVWGKTVVMNQMMYDGNFTDIQNWQISGYGYTLSMSDNTAIAERTESDANHFNLQNVNAKKTYPIKGHKYYLACDALSVNGDGNMYFLIGGASASVTNAISTSFVRYSAILTATNNTQFPDIYVAGNSIAVGSILQFKNFICVDLTLLYGSGNEPSTVAEFEAMFPASYYAYNAGELLSAGVTSVVSKDSNNATLQAISIPASIQALEGYGWSAGTAYNYVDFERKVFVQNVGAVDLGTLNWVYDGNYFSVATPSNAKSSISSGIPAVCGRYESYFGRPVAFTTSDKSIICNSSYMFTGVTFVKDSAYSDATTFKSAMSGVYLYYELATPIETDISAYLTDDNLINVESGGTLTFENQNGDDYRIPVPSEETYMIDLQEAINNG